MVAAEIHECAYPAAEISDVGLMWQCRKCGIRWRLAGGTLFAWSDGAAKPVERQWLRWERAPHDD
jgi:hypothetical protein